MASILRMVLLLVIALPISACGLKGKLKTPEQIQKIEAKKAQEEEKKAQEIEKDTDEPDIESAPAEKK